MAAGVMNIVIDGLDNVVDELQDMRDRSKKVVQRTIADFKTRGPSWVAGEVAKEYNIKKADIKCKNTWNKNWGFIHNIQRACIDAYTFWYETNNPS